MLQNQEESLGEEEEEKIVQKPKPKKKVSEAQAEIGRANLAKGRQALAEKRLKEKAENQIVADEMIIKKAEKLVKQKANKEKQLKSIIGVVEEEIEIEEHIIKKPKKKRIIYKEESDSEEEVVIKSRKPMKELPTQKTIEPIPVKPIFSIKFC